MASARTKSGVYKFAEKSWGHISDDAKDVIRNLLILDPDKRISLKVIIV